MTGVRAGSQGTGLRGGSAGGSGVVGGGAAPEPVWLDGANSGDGAITSWVTPSWTPLVDEATYILAVSTGYASSSQSVGAVTVTGMSTAWTRVAELHYDAAGVATGRLDVFKSPPGVIPTAGTLTVTLPIESAAATASLAAFPGDIRVLNSNSGSAAGGGPLNIAIPGGAPMAGGRSLVAIHSDMHPGTGNGTPDPALTALGRSGAGLQGIENYISWVTGDDAPGTVGFTSTTVNADHSMGGVLLEVVSGIPVYNVALEEVSARYPLTVKNTAADIPGYSVAVQDGLGANASYPLETRTSELGGLSTYDTAAALALTTYIPGTTKGVGSDPNNYETESTARGLTTYIQPAAKGVGTDPVTYDAANYDATRAFPLESTAVGTAIPSYDTTIATKDRTRHFPLETVV